MMPMLRCLIPAMALITLAACDTEERTAAKASADGAILDGSVSDAMLPLDTARSQAPLAPRVEASGPAGGGEVRSRSRSRTSDEDVGPATADPVAANPEPAIEAEPATPDEE